MLIHPVLASAIDIGAELLGLTQQARQTRPRVAEQREDDCLGCDAWVHYR